jgi:hypothetical protein
MADIESQSLFTQSLFRIDPTEGLVQYVKAIKPYHTKILDVLVEYVYAEDVNITITDALSWVMEFRRPDVDTVYSCGYSSVWDPVLTPTTPDNPLALMTILEATEAIDAPLPGAENSNTFLIESAAYVPFEVAVVSTLNNQLVLSKNYDIIGVDPITNEWEIDDPLNTLVAELTTFPTPKTFYVSSNTGLSGNGSYVVLGVPVHLAGTTTVTVDGAISVQANPDGVFHRVLELAEVPQWPASQAVTFTTASGTLPAPLVDGTRYYFQPTLTVAYFNLSTVRNPLEYTDYVNLTTLGAGTFTIERDESLIPGAVIIVTNTPYSRNNGQYIVKDIQSDGVNERVFVYEKVDNSTPLANIGAEGHMQLKNIGFAPPIFCPPTEMSDFHADAFFGESLKFSFELNLFDMMESSLDENRIYGYGETEYGNGMLGSFGTSAQAFQPRTAQTSGSPGADSAHSILPTGIDTQLFDVGGFDEILATVKTFYGREIP